MSRPANSLLLILMLLTGATLGIGTTALLDWDAFGKAQDSPRAPSEADASNGRRILHWRAPMDPNYRSDAPGKSPMGMDLIPVYDRAGSNGDSVRVSPRFLQNFAVRTAEVRRRDLPRSIRTVGVLAHNDEKVVSVNTKFEGWIERAAVNNVGESVRRGDVLFEIYSPELVTTQQEYLATLAYLNRLRAGGAFTFGNPSASAPLHGRTGALQPDSKREPQVRADAISRAEALLQATRERLRHWDVTEAQIAALEAAGKASRTLPFLAPAAGFVVAKMGDSLDGMKLTPGMTVLKIADHSTLWVEAQLFDEDVRHVHEGSPATIAVDAFPARRWEGRIRFFRSAVSAETRALTAFVEIANPDLSLRPMMYADVSIEAEGVRDALVAPAESVLRTGTRSVVIVDRGAGVFEPREVALGLTANGLQEITAGLAAGERVVVSSQFLIDSESNLQAATAQLQRGAGAWADSPDPHDAGATASPSRHADH